MKDDRDPPVKVVYSRIISMEIGRIMSCLIFYFYADDTMPETNTNSENAQRQDHVCMTLRQVVS